MTKAADLNARLRALHEQTAENPLFNPVFQLGHEISKTIESGATTLSDIGDLVSELECEGLQSRARRLARLLMLDGAQGDKPSLAGLIDQKDDFEAFQRRWLHPRLHIVFTAHPTFLLTPEQSDAIAASVEAGAIGSALCPIPAGRPAVTLTHEHDEAMAALCRAQDARDEIVAHLLAHAAKQWPDRWRQLRPMPFRFATWVGYDMDGRTDIGWQVSLSFRLQEKALRLERYASAIEKIDSSHQLLQRLNASLAHTRELQLLFAGNLSAPSDFAEAADRLSANHPAKLISLDPIINKLEAEAAQAPASKAIQLLTLAAAMRADGLGMGAVHFRVNSAQLDNAIRRRIDPDNRLDLSSKAALARLRQQLETVRPLKSNMAALEVESSTAARQFLAMVQILAHVDADTPIRMLIAECEHPATILAGLYFTRLFGIEDRVDLSPLFETESAMEHGGRFLEALLSEPAYRDYVRRRGRVSIQTGFSDAGRFVGQIPAALAIERLQGALARAMARRDLADVAALIFNTHGESMGRGAHPSSLKDRLTWPMSLWAREEFVRAGVRTELEASFQGGDGYLFFRSPSLARATLLGIAEAESGHEPAGADPFYTRTDLSLDFYRGIRRVQRSFMLSRTYARSITAFGLGLLNETGSRRSRRQFDIAADREMSLRQIRAIPHNAILQQLGYPVNLIAGGGTAAMDDEEGIAELLNASHRGQQIVRLLRAADHLSSIKTVAAYGELFNSAYWASRPYRGTERHLEQACLALADQLTTDDRASAFRTLVSRLRVDAVKLHRLLAFIPNDDNQADTREEDRRTLGALHALRLALMQHVFLLAIRIPAFSRSDDVSRDDVLQMIFSLRIDEAVDLLRRAYPVSEPSASDFALSEPTEYPDDGAEGYARIHADYIDPIANSYALILRIGASLANHFGAHG